MKFFFAVSAWLQAICGLVFQVIGRDARASRCYALGAFFLAAAIYERVKEIRA